MIHTTIAVLLDTTIFTIINPWPTVHTSVDPLFWANRAHQIASEYRLWLILITEYHSNSIPSLIFPFFSGCKRYLTISTGPTFHRHLDLIGHDRFHRSCPQCHTGQSHITKSCWILWWSWSREAEGATLNTKMDECLVLFTGALVALPLNKFLSMEGFLAWDLLVMPAARFYWFKFPEMTMYFIWQIIL